VTLETRAHKPVGNASPQIAIVKRAERAFEVRAVGKIRYHIDDALMTPPLALVP
jgi:hypothetical protein